MKSKILLIVLFSIIIFTSCRKDNNEVFHLSGTITDSKSGNGIEGAEIIFWSSKIQSGVFNSNYETIAVLTTDYKGSYSVDIKNEKVIGYKVSISKFNYFSYEEDISAESFLPDKSYVLNYSINPAGYIKLRAVNTNPYDSNDFISYRFISGYMNCMYCCNNVANKGYGENFDSTFVCKTIGGSKPVISWNVIKNGQSVINSAEINCPVFDTVYFVISY
mgnify:CR=1 FL=1|jgi:hypothetical protein